MIGRAYRYKGVGADAARLHSHLWKSEDQRPVLIGTRNLFARDSAEAMSVMIALKAASKATIAFWHVVVSPRKTLSDTEAATVVDLIVTELNAQSHPMLIFGHQDKPRARPGGGGNHFHIVLGHVSPITFRALDMRNHAPRLHKVWAIAEFNIEGVATASPWHASIVDDLRATGNDAVADWMVDQLGESPRLKAPRMTDSMRRSAAGAGFALPSFQAGLESLWKRGASQTEVKGFLEANDVIVRPGQSANGLAFYRGDLFVGALHRILQQDVSGVYGEALRRYPELLAAGAHDRFREEALLRAPSPTRGPTPEVRALNLQRQRRIDEIERRLFSVRSERMHHTYIGPHKAPMVQSSSTPPFLPFSQAAASSSEYGRGADDKLTMERRQPDSETGARIRHLLQAEAVLEAAQAGVWQEDRWISAPLAELLRWARASLGNLAAVAPTATAPAEGNPVRDDETPTPASFR